MVAIFREFRAGVTEYERVSEWTVEGKGEISSL